MGVELKKYGVIRYPKLDTLLMIERTLQKNSGKLGKKDAWQKLPKKMMYQTFCVGIDYLLFSKRIMMDSKGMIRWVGHQNKNDLQIKNKYLFWK